VHRFLALAVLASARALAQPPGAVVRVRVVHDAAAVAGAIARIGPVAQLTDTAGAAALRVVPGRVMLVVARLGFHPDTSRFTLNPGADTLIMVRLQQAAHAAAAVVIATTRAERRVDDTPIRVEVVDEDEILEKGAMTPGDITMLLNETPGLRVQTVSPSLGGAGVRVQGLQGRYTLLLADGLPLYGGASGGLGLLQIPPVDLARAEIIKGTASALYGPSALGGVINLVSRRPGAEPERELLINQTNRRGTDVVYFSARPIAREGWGITLLTSVHRQERSDLDGDGWTDMPMYKRAVLRQRLFFDDGARRSLLVTAGATVEDRGGGTMPGRTAPDGRPFAEGIKTARYDIGATGRIVRAGGAILAGRASLARQGHQHQVGAVRETDEHGSAFAEATATLPRGKNVWVLGASGELSDYSSAAVPVFDYRYASPALFAQLDRDVTRWLVLSGNARVDGHSDYGTVFSPRVSMLLRAPTGPFAGWNVRLSAGRGTFAPVPKTEVTEVTGLTPLRPLGDLAAERATGMAADLGGLIHLGGDALLELNLSAFANEVADAIHTVPAAIVAPGDTGTTPGGARFIQLVNAPLPTRTAGGELLARLVAGDARITASYGHTTATEWDDDFAGAPRRVSSPLIPRHTAGLVATLGREGRGRAGLELYYVGRQRLDDDPYRTESRPYVVIGLLLERVIGRARWIINAENLLDERQTRYDPLVLPARGRGGRWTTDVWSLLEGRTVNAGVRISW
jgi:iron complex outermembrane receptor protein